MVGWAAALGALVLVAMLWPRVHARVLLSRAKHPSLSGHGRIARRLAKLVPYYAYDERRVFASDGAPAEIAERRRAAFEGLSQLFAARAPRTIEASEKLAAGMSDVEFTRTYRVPFQYSHYVRARLKVGAVVVASKDVQLTDLDGNVSFDLGGSYGVNVFGNDFYKACVDAGIERVRTLGPVLGVYHPVVEENVRRLRDISGLDEVSFHMSGTEAVMQAVRLARYHTGRSHLVQFPGSYHGWWDGVQPGVGNPRPVSDAYVLREMDDRTLRVLERRRDIACVLVNPLQILHPNTSPPGDGSLMTSASTPPADPDTYAAWLRRLREVCTARGIVLIFDEVFLGFRLAYGGAQEYFGVRADMVTYGKTVGGGLPIGVLCGARRLMRRYRDDRPADVCFARGTFNTHPYVMGSMNEFLRRIDTPAVRASYAGINAVWNARVATLNDTLAGQALPVRVANLCSVWTVRYTRPSRYNWMFQYYLRKHGLALSWVGSGRLIFSHNYSDATFAAVAQRFVDAATEMQADGWWWQSAALTNRAIMRQVFRETIAARVRPDARAGSAPASGPTAAGSGPPRDNRIDQFAAQ